jgi:hypothetical protein
MSPRSFTMRTPTPTQVISLAARKESSGGVDGLVILYSLTDSEIKMYSGSEKRAGLQSTQNTHSGGVGIIITEHLDEPMEVKLTKEEMYNPNYTYSDCSLT